MNIGMVEKIQPKAVYAKLCYYILANWNEIRTKFGYQTLCERLGP